MIITVIVINSDITIFFYFYTAPFSPFQPHPLRPLYTAETKVFSFFIFTTLSYDLIPFFLPTGYNNTSQAYKLIDIYEYFFILLKVSIDKDEEIGKERKKEKLRERERERDGKCTQLNIYIHIHIIHINEHTYIYIYKYFSINEIRNCQEGFRDPWRT